MRGRVRRDNGEVRQLKNTAIENECKGGCKVRQPSWQQHRGDDNDERIEEIQRAVYAAGCVNHERDQRQIRKHLEQRLNSVLFPERKQYQVENRNRVPQQHNFDEQAQRDGIRRQPRDREFDAQQKCQNNDADLDQPGQPLPLIEHGLHFPDPDFCRIAGRTQCAARLRDRLSRPAWRSLRTAAYIAKSQCLRS